MSGAGAELTAAACACATGAGAFGAGLDSPAGVLLSPPLSFGCSPAGVLPPPPVSFGCSPARPSLPPPLPLWRSLDLLCFSLVRDRRDAGDAVPSSLSCSPAPSAERAGWAGLLAAPCGGALADCGPRCGPLPAEPSVPVAASGLPCPCGEGEEAVSSCPGAPGVGRAWPGLAVAAGAGTHKSAPQLRATATPRPRRERLRGLSALASLSISPPGLRSPERARAPRRKSRTPRGSHPGLKTQRS